MADDERGGPSLELPSFRRGARPAKPRRATRIPGPTGPVAAGLTGLAVGLAGVGLTWLLQRGCEQVSGTSSCGNPGLLLLLGLVVALGLLGAALLRAFGVRHPGSTSTLAVALLTVVTLLFLGDELLARSMVVVVPLLAMAAFVVAQVVTKAADSVES